MEMQKQATATATSSLYFFNCVFIANCTNIMKTITVQNKGVFLQRNAALFVISTHRKFKSDVVNATAND